MNTKLNERFIRDQQADKVLTTLHDELTGLFQAEADKQREIEKLTGLMKTLAITLRDAKDCIVTGWDAHATGMLKESIATALYAAEDYVHLCGEPEGVTA
jgi:hypothetical protein